MNYITGNLLFISFFILIIHCIETLAYSTRLSGARVGLIASALSMFNMIVVVSRLANMMQQPFTGGLIDNAPEENTLLIVEEQYRFIIGASTVGTLIGILLMPTFIALFSRAILHLAAADGSMPTLLKKGVSFAYVKRGIAHFHLPSRIYLKDFALKSISIRFFFINMIITAIYTIGVLSALYAALLVPERSAAAMMASGLVNGVATILLTVFIDPKISVLADDVVKGRRSYSTLKNMSILMMGSRLVGTIFAQVLFIPGAYYVAWFTQFMV